MAAILEISIEIFRGILDLLSFISLKPKVVVRKNKLIAESSFRFLIMTAFIFKKKIIVDSTTKFLSIDKTVFWIFSSFEKIKFSSIKSIKYSYVGYPTAINHKFDTTSALDDFTVSIELIENNDLVTLFSFIGDSGIRCSSGGQENSSKQFVEQLMDLTGKGLT
jgi:hypothetical protein